MLSNISELFLYHGSVLQNPQNEKFALETFFWYYFQVNNFSVILGHFAFWVEHGLYKQRIYCLAQGQNTVPAVSLNFFSDQFIFQRGGGP